MAPSPGTHCTGGSCLQSQPCEAGALAQEHQRTSYAVYPLILAPLSAFLGGCGRIRRQRLALLASDVKLMVRNYLSQVSNSMAIP